MTAYRHVRETFKYPHCVIAISRMPIVGFCVAAIHFIAMLTWASEKPVVWMIVVPTIFTFAGPFTFVYRLTIMRGNSKPYTPRHTVFYPKS